MSPIIKKKTLYNKLNVNLTQIIKKTTKQLSK
jgi:hypothetical protein